MFYKDLSGCYGETRLSRGRGLGARVEVGRPVWAVAVVQLRGGGGWAQEARSGQLLASRGQMDQLGVGSEKTSMWDSESLQEVKELGTSCPHQSSLCHEGPQDPHSGVRVIIVTQSADTWPASLRCPMAGQRCSLLPCELDASPSSPSHVASARWYQCSEGSCPFMGSPCFYRWSSEAEGTGWASDRASWSLAPRRTE